MPTVQPLPGLGVPPLDRVLAPVPVGATVAFLNDPGVDAEPFLYQAAGAHLEAGDEVVYVITNRRPSAVADAMLEMGFDAVGSGPRLCVVDAYSALLGESSGASVLVRNPADPAELASALEGMAAEHPGAVLIVDSLSSVLDNASPEAVLAALPRLLGAMRRFRLATVLLTRWAYGDVLDALLPAFDALVTLRGVEERVLYRQYFAVERAAWAGSQDAKPRLYRVMKPGGVVSYVPKVLVTGPHDAGKSSFVHAASDQSASADFRGTTVAMDHGHVTYEGLSADLFGTPGQSRFDPLIRMLSEQALGVIVVVDSTKPETFPRAREMLHATWKESLPAVIAANKQDQKGALRPEEVARVLEPPRGVPVVGCQATDPASARAVLDGLLERILAGGVTA